jgi:predicted MFS family arabinose efflux permease
MRNRKARVGQFTTPTARGTALWAFLIVLVLGIYAATDSLWLLFGTFILSGVVSCTYAHRSCNKLRRTI